MTMFLFTFRLRNRSNIANTGLCQMLIDDPWQALNVVDDLNLTKSSALTVEYQQNVNEHSQYQQSGYQLHPYQQNVAHTSTYPLPVCPQSFNQPPVSRQYMDQP